MAKTEAQLKKLGGELAELQLALGEKETQLKSWEESLEKQNKELEDGIKDLYEREKVLVDREAEMSKWEEERELSLTVQEEELSAKMAELKEREKALARAGGEVKAEEMPELTAAQKKLIAAGCEAYGIADEFVFSSRVKPDEITGEAIAVILTNGGAKVFFKKGDEVEPLHHIRVTGINPEAKKRKPIVGKKKK